MLDDIDETCLSHILIPSMASAEDAPRKAVIKQAQAVEVTTTSACSLLGVKHSSSIRTNDGVRSASPSTREASLHRNDGFRVCVNLPQVQAI
jgi:hypothetical protein